MIGRKRKRLGDLLVDAGVVTSEQLGEALKKQRELGLKLGETLIELKFTDENEIVEALHQQMGYPVAKIREAKIAPEVISLLPETIVRKHNVVPFEVDPDNPNILRVAMADPMDIIAIDDLAIVTNMQIEAMVATPSDVRFGIERYYHKKSGRFPTTPYLAMGVYLVLLWGDTVLNWYVRTFVY